MLTALPAFVLLACQPAEPGRDPGDETATESMTTDTGTLPARGDCNPVEDSHCMLPFPSDFFLSPDAQTATGLRVDLGPGSLPVNVDGVGMDPTTWNEKDGFSTLGALLVHLPGASTGDLIGHEDLGAYLEADARTVIIDATTGERHPHFVEREAAAAGTGRDLLSLRPVTPLAHATRYVVGIRDLTDEAGDPVAAPAGFAALRDAETPSDPYLSDPDLWRQQDHYDEVVFPTLEGAGLQRDELTLAWSFTTVSAESSLGRTIWMRDDALARLADGEPSYTISEIVEADCTGDDPPAAGRTVRGELTLPLYRASTDRDALLSRDDDGAPYYTGETEVGFSAVIPCDLLTSPRPGRLVQYGHGLFGGRGEVESDYLAEMAQTHGLVLFGMDWTGMSALDLPHISLMLVQEPGNFAVIPEGVAQGLIELTVAGRMARETLALDDAFMQDGERLIDPDLQSFYGNSMGGVLGGAYLGLSPDIDRGVLGVAGMPFNLLLSRSASFADYLRIMAVMYDDWADITVFLTAAQTLWDPGEAAGWAHYVTAPLDDTTTARDVLVHAAIGDASVPSLGAHVMARAYGIPLVTPAPREVWGLAAQEAPTAGSGLVEFDFGVEEPVASIPADEDAGAHDGPRHSTAGQEQIGVFLTTGTIENHCDGACDPD